MAIYTEADYTAICQQKKKRWRLLLIPILILMVLMVVSLVIRSEVMTIACTILAGVTLIAGYDFSIKPLRCYKQYLNDLLHGRTRECELTFIHLSEDVNVVDGVPCRALTCNDLDAKGRPYERLFYFDAQKDFPACQPGDLLHITHHELNVADVELA